MRKHLLAVLNQEDEISIPVAEGLDELFKLRIDNIVFCKDVSELVCTLTANARVKLLTRIDAL